MDLTEDEILEHAIHLIVLLITEVIPKILQVIRMYYLKEPYHTSILTGEGWVQELLNGHPRRIYTELGVSKELFYKLLLELRLMGYEHTRYISLEEQLAIFLYTCVTGMTIRHVGERFQRASGTCSKYFKQMVRAFSSHSFYAKYVKQPPAYDNSTHPLRNKPKLYPFFRGALGAIDGSHIHFAPPRAQQAAYRNRKGYLSQNCLFACTFTMSFTYALTGWEGSATDSKIWDDATDLKIPPNCYYLGDAGFPHCDKLLVPYRGVRYHLAEWGRSKHRPKNKYELFNLRHAQARNVIERIFGVLKGRYRILLLAPKYSIAIQTRLPAALVALHNFIQAHNPNDDATSLEISSDHASGGFYTRGFSGGAENQDDGPESEATKRRNQIAEEMWIRYNEVLQERAEADLLNDYNNDDDEDEDKDDDKDKDKGTEYDEGGEDDESDEDGSE